MAATQRPIVWDFYRKQDDADDLGAVLHYYDTNAQSIFLEDGELHTRTSKPINGTWETASQSSDIDISSDAFTQVAFDHNYLSTVHGSAVDSNNNLYYLRYQYEEELTDICRKGTIKMQNDSPVYQLSLTINNVNQAMFANSYTLFNPGAAITVDFALGNSEHIRMITAYMDDIDIDIYSDTVPVSGRNAMGYLLKDQTLDEHTNYSGYSHEVASALLANAGVTNYIVMPGTNNQSWEFEPDETYLDALNKMIDFFQGWQMEELQDGTVILGYSDLKKQYNPNSTYEFDGGTELVKRKTTKSLDGAYTRVRATGKDASNNDLTPVYVNVTHWDHWSIGSHKTKHIDFGKGKTQQELQQAAEEYAASLQRVGIGEDFDGPLRPQLLIGDIAAIRFNDESPSTLGLITSVTHSFGQDGFFTQFSVDSGGAISIDGEYAATRIPSLDGSNRTQRLSDLIKLLTR